jgi:hypothetical protein
MIRLHLFKEKEGGSPLGGQWKEKEKEKVLMLRGQWKEKEKVLMLGDRWKEKEKVLMLKGQWKEKEKVLFHLFPLFPQATLLRPLFFFFDIKVLLYHGFRPLFTSFLPFPWPINYDCTF